MTVSEQDLERLRTAASQARDRAHAPYSRFHVGAALLGADGRVYAGCNLENASFGLSVCAERHALAAALLAGALPPQGLLVLTAATTPTTPCGACRQVLSELAPPSLVVRCENTAGDVLEVTLGELLPHGFDAHSLE